MAATAAAACVTKAAHILMRGREPRPEAWRRSRGQRQRPPRPRAPHTRRAPNHPVRQCRGRFAPPLGPISRLNGGSREERSPASSTEPPRRNSRTPTATTCRRTSPRDAVGVGSWAKGSSRGSPGEPKQPKGACSWVGGVASLSSQDRPAWVAISAASSRLDPTTNAAWHIASPWNDKTRS